jgi:hypothetical protein
MQNEFGGTTVASSLDGKYIITLKSKGISIF